MYTPARHQYLRALADSGTRPRVHNKVGFTLMEDGLVDWVYPLEGVLLAGDYVRNRLPLHWNDETRSKAVERITLDGMLKLVRWNAGVRD